MSKKIILIGDNEKYVHKTIGEYLEEERIEYISSYDELDILNKLKATQVDLILLDIAIPRVSGIDLCREIRKYSNAPIIILTSKSDIIDKIVYLELIADDYITKPFSTREVITRIKTILRRYDTYDRTKNFIRYEDIEINLNNCEVYIKNKLVKFTRKEINILHILISNPRKILDREYILSEVWGSEYLGDARVVDTQIKKIRKKFRIEGLNYKIKSTYGVGYQFEV